MPVKLTEDGKPLEQALQQPPPAPPPPPAGGSGGAGGAMQAVPAGAATDALLEQAEATIAGGPGQPVVAHAESGTMDKEGVITAVTSEQVATGMHIPAGYKGPFTKVTVGMAAVVNTGNYENIRPFVQIEIPCVPGHQDAVYDWGYDWVDNRIAPQIKAIQQATSGA